MAYNADTDWRTDGRHASGPRYTLCAFCGGDLEEHEAERGYCARCEKWANEHGLDTDN